MDAQEGISGATSGGRTSKASNRKEGMAAEADCFIDSLRL